MNMNECYIGAKVRIVRESTIEEDKVMKWTPGMYRTIGDTCVISDFNREDGTVCLRNKWWYCTTQLELVNDDRKVDRDPLAGAMGVLK